MRIDLTGTPFESSRSHYFNRLPDGTIRDFSADQFGGWKPDYFNAEAEERDRANVLSFVPTSDRYELLKSRFEAARND